MPNSIIAIPILLTHIHIILTPSGAEWSKTRGGNSVSIPPTNIRTTDFFSFLSMSFVFKVVNTIIFFVYTNIYLFLRQSKLFFKKVTFILNKVRKSLNSKQINFNRLAQNQLERRNFF